jgi:hypothetical protein
MNDEPSASAAFSPPSPTARASPTAPATTSDDIATDAPDGDAAAVLHKRNREYLLRKRGELMDDALRHLDILVYAELSVIYYMECVAQCGHSKLHS